MVQFSSVPRPIGSLGAGAGKGHEGRFSRDPLPVFSAGNPCEQLWHAHGCPVFDVVHPAFPLPTMASPTLQGALKDGFGQATDCGSEGQKINSHYVDGVIKTLSRSSHTHAHAHTLARAHLTIATHALI